MRGASLAVAALVFTRLGASATLAPHPLTYDAIVYSGTNCGGTSAVTSDIANPCAINAPVAFSVAPQYIKSGSQTATWNFGDGSAPLTAPANTSVTHTFTTFGRFMVL